MRVPTALAIALLAVRPASAQTAAPLDRAALLADSARVAIEAAWLARDAARLETARRIAERGLTAFPNDALLLHYNAYALYREVSLDASRPGAPAPAARLDLARQALERSVAIRPLPESWMLLSSVYGQLIGTDPSQAMTLGPESMRASEEAMSRGSANPRVHVLKGVALFYTPAEWGGGLEPADKALQRAIDLFAADHPAPPLPAWGRGEAYAWRGQILAKQGKITEARAAYAKALEVEPANVWVRTSLLPQLDKLAPR